jgi:50S ribosomal protein L16 3-hydroxylase
MFKQLSDENMTSLMAKFLTQAHHELDIIEPEQAFTTDDLIMLSDDHQLQLKPVLGIKILRTEAPEQLFINGMVIDIDEETRYLANILAVNENVTMASIKSSLGSLKNQVLLTTVLNMGFWYLE